MPQRFNDDPLIQALCNRQTVWWRNPHLAPFAQAAGDVGLTADDVAQAAARLARFAPYLAAVFRKPKPQAASSKARCTACPLCRTTGRDVMPCST